jgi:hypothetical protein
VYNKNIKKYNIEVKMTRLTFANIRPTRVFDSSGYALYYTAGNVGIGTNNPTSTLEVSGNVNIDSGLLFLDASNNRVGIGKTNPSVALDVSGNVNVNTRQLSVVSSNQLCRFDIDFNNSINDIQYRSSTNELFIGGYFTTCRIVETVIATNATVYNILYTANYMISISLTDGTVNTFGSGLQSWVEAIVFSGNDVYVGGGFTSAGGVANTSRIARWNSANSTWNALGTGLNDTCAAMDVSGINLYAGGDFTSAGGVANTSRIARWDISNSLWNAMTTGLNDRCRAIAVSGSDVYVGGWFTQAGGIANTPRIARWTGSTWAPMASGLPNGYCRSIAVRGTDVYVGGGFTSITSVSNASYIARWNGSAWFSLGTGIIGDVVWTLAISGTNLYVCGGFTSAGGVSNTTRIARWDISNSSWHAMSTGINAVGIGLETVGSDVYVGGALTTAGGVSVNYFARWDGSAWSKNTQISPPFSCVGIGKSNPLIELDVSGNAFISGNLAIGKPNSEVALDVSGYVKTNMVGFFAMHTGTSISTVSANNYSANIFTTVRHNLPTNILPFTASTGIFTAPVAGYYFFSATSWGIYSSATAFVFRKVSGGTTTDYGGAYSSYGSINGYISSSAFIQLAQNDTVGVYAPGTQTVYQSNGGAYPSFSGYLIYAS